MKLESNFKNMVLVLTTITLVAAGSLGGVYSLTEAPIAASKKAKQEQAFKDVLPAYDRMDDAKEVNGLKIYKAYMGNEFVGAAVESAQDGFSSVIKLMVGFDKEGTIVNYSVLQQTETPGLGTKIVEWFKTDKNDQDIRGLNPSEVNLVVKKDGGDVDAITASTVSSRAFLAAVRNAYAAYAADNASTVQIDDMTAATQEAEVDSINTNQ